MLALKMDTKQIDDAFERLLAMPQIIEKAVVAAITDTVHDIHTRQIKEMEMVFDAPTPWIKKGLIKALPYGKDRGQFGNKRLGQSIGNSGVYFEDFPRGKSQSDVIRPHVYGGTRGKKPNEKRLASIGAFTSNSQFAIPAAGYPRNQYGNVPGSVYSRMLSDLGAIETAQPLTKDGKAKPAKFFVMRNESGQEYIAERIGDDLRTVLIFVDKVNYKVRYNFHEIASQQFDVSMPRHLDRILKRYMSRM